MFKIVKFDNTLVTRKATYPFNVVLRNGPTIVLVSEECYTPKGMIVTSNFYREWTYGRTWHLVVVPGQKVPELTFENHVEANGEIL